MLATPVLDTLRQRISNLEERPRRFSRTIPVADDIDRWLPFGGLSTGCIHEIKGSSLANAIAFSSVLASRVAGGSGSILYIAADRSLHPLGLLPFGIRLEKLLYVSPQRTKDVAWTVMEALRCRQVSAVLALLEGLNLTESRRLQLATESNGTTGFLLGPVASMPIAAPITRWTVSSVTGKTGQRFDEPLWAVDLLYCRGGRPGSWTVEWRGEKLSLVQTQQKQKALREALAG